MAVVNVGGFQVEYVSDIPYEDLSVILTGLDGLQKGVNVDGFKKIGKGSSALVYGYENYAIKKLYDDSTFGEQRDNDVQVLKDLGHLECIPALYAVIDDNTIIMQRVNGATVDDFCGGYIKNENITVDDRFVEKWDNALLSIIANGYSPNDLHEQNVMIEENTNNPIIVDTGWFYKHGNKYDINDKDNLRSDESYGRANRWAGRVIRDYVKNRRDSMDCTGYVGF